MLLKSLLKQNRTVYSVAKFSQNIINNNVLGLVKKKGLKRKEYYVTIKVDVNRTLEKYEKFWGGFGQESFYSGVTFPKNQAFFDIIAEDSRKKQVIKYYRAHNIFSDRNSSTGKKAGGRVYSEDINGNPNYNWNRMDQVFDTIIGADLKPIVEFGFMPEALTSDPERIGDWDTANVAPPKDYMKWRNLVFETVKHLKERYGAAEIESWYFEVWNEPDLWKQFWIPNPQNPERTNLNEYCKLYDYTVDGAESAHAKIKIGGPAIAGWPYFLEGFLKHIKDGTNYVTSAKGSRLDFISFHRYGSIEGSIIQNSKHLIEKALEVDKSRFSSLPFLLDEFGPTTRSREPWKNSSYPAAWICKTIDAMFEMGYNRKKIFRPEAMIFWGHVGDNYKAGGGILATSIGKDQTNVLKGPVYNGFDALSRLSDERISLTGTEFGDYVHGIATKSQNSVEVILYHLGNKSNTPKDTVTVSLNVVGLPQKSYSTKHFLIDETHSNAYSLWKQLGGPADPDPEQIILLQDRDDLEQGEPTYIVYTPNAVFEKTVKLPSNSVSLFILSEITDFVRPNKPRELTFFNVTSNALKLKWREPESAEDSETASSYVIYRNEKQIAKTFSAVYFDSGLVDNSSYKYEIYAVDAQGNLSVDSEIKTISTLRDTVIPHVTSLDITNVTTIYINFNESLHRLNVMDITNYDIKCEQKVQNGEVIIKQVEYNDLEKRLTIKTTPHQVDIPYSISFKDIKDKAKKPNIIKNKEHKYMLSLTFRDDFLTNTTEKYSWDHYNMGGGIGKHSYDQDKFRLFVNAGDNIGERFSHWLPEVKSGHFGMSFLPTKKYPKGGRIAVNLKQDDNNYFQVANTDGYGQSWIKKFIDGVIVDSLYFSTEYSQNVSYELRIEFNAGFIDIKSFMNIQHQFTNKTPIWVRKFEVSLYQQDAFFNYIYFKGN